MKVPSLFSFTPKHSNSDDNGKSQNDDSSKGTSQAGPSLAADNNNSNSTSLPRLSSPDSDSGPPMVVVHHSRKHSRAAATSASPRSQRRSHVARGEHLQATSMPGQDARDIALAACDQPTNAQLQSSPPIPRSISRRDVEAISIAPSIDLMSTASRRHRAQRLLDLDVTQLFTSDTVAPMRTQAAEAAVNVTMDAKRAVDRNGGRAESPTGAIPILSSSALAEPTDSSSLGSRGEEHRGRPRAISVLSPACLADRTKSQPELAAATPRDVVPKASHEGVPPLASSPYRDPATMTWHYARRPTSPTGSMTFSTVSFRDPKEYRQRIESIRAEAGTSWLSAFVELQNQQLSASSLTPQPQSQQPSESPDIGWQEDTNAAFDESAGDLESDKSSTIKLPEFLFPRRSRAPHRQQATPNSTVAGQQPAATASPTSVASSGSSAHRDNTADRVPSPTQKSAADTPIASPLRSPSVSSSQVELTPSQRAAAELPASAATAEISRVHRTQFAAATDWKIDCRTQFASADALPSASSTVLVRQPLACIPFRLVMPDDDHLYLVTHSETNASSGGNDSSNNRNNISKDLPEVVDKYPYLSLMRLEALSSPLLQNQPPGSRASRMQYGLEIKQSRYDHSAWLDFEIDPVQHSDFLNKIKGVVNFNWDPAHGSAVYLYKRGRCVKCGWTGYIDDDLQVFDRIAGGLLVNSGNADNNDAVKTMENERYLLLEPSPHPAGAVSPEDAPLSSGACDVKCPSCSRNYVVEFYGDDDDEHSDVDDTGKGDNKEGGEVVKLEPAATNGEESGVPPHISTLGRKLTWKSLLNPLQFQLSIKRSLAGLDPKATSEGPDTATTKAAQTSQQLARMHENINDPRWRVLCEKDPTGLTSSVVKDITTRTTNVTTVPYIPFLTASNSLLLHLQLTVFETDDERLLRWVPAGLIEQTYPRPPRITSPALRLGSSSSVGGKSRRWGFGQMLYNSKSSKSDVGPASLPSSIGTEGAPSSTPGKAASAAATATAATAAADEVDSEALELELAVKRAYLSDITERPVFLALSNVSVYIFILTNEFWARLGGDGDGSADHISETEQHPDKYLKLIDKILISRLRRVDIGPNRQYLTLHTELFDVPPPALTERDASKSSGSSIRAASTPRRSLVLMIRDKFVCSDLLNSLVEVLYESGSTAMPWPKPQSTQAEAEGGAVTRPHQIINHDVEWAMHHLRRQVFLKPSTFAYLKDKYGATALGPEDDRESTVAAADNQTKTAKPSGAQKVPLAPASPWLDCVRQRELGSLWQELHLSGCDRGGPGAMIDPASGDNVIIDKVTYEFLKLYHCIGWIPKYPARAASAQGLYQQPIGLPGLQPRTVVATQHFLYLVRERVDVWPPPAATLTRFYRQWQTAEPPMIVTSDPDSYDPESITELLQARSRANSSAASSTISALTRTSSASNTPLSSSLERTWPASSSLPAPLPITLSLENMCEWTAEHISQYDRVERVRPVECLNNIEVRPLNLIVKPSPQPGLSSGENNGSSAKGGAKASGDDDYTMELEKWGLDKRLVMGCTATGWSTLVRLAFKPLVSVRPDLDPDMLDHSQDKGLQQQYSVWDLFFATSSSANDFIESIKALTSKIDMPEIRVSTAGEGN